MSFNPVEISKEDGTPYELYLFLYGDQQPDTIEFTFNGLPTPENIPDTTPFATAFSPDGKIVAVGNGDESRFTIFIVAEGGEFFAWNDPALVKPAGAVTALAFKGNGNHLLIGSENVAGQDNVHLYRVDYQNGGFWHLTFLSSWVATKPVDGSGSIRAIAYTPDQQHALVAHDGFPYVSFYSIAGNAYTEFSGFAMGAPGVVNSIDFKSNLHVAMTTEHDAPLVYSRAGTVYTRLATVPIAVDVGETINAARWNPTGDMLVVCRSGPPYINFFGFDGTDITPMINVIGGGPGSVAYDVLFDTNNFGMLVAQAGAPYVTSYQVQPTVVVRTAEFAVTLHGATRSLIGSPDDKYVIAGNIGAPSMTFIERVTGLSDGASGYYAYTNADRPVDAEIPGIGTVVTFMPIPIDRESYSSNGKSEPTNMTIKMPKNTDLANLFKPYPPPQPVGVVIMGRHHTDTGNETVVFWTGKVLACDRAGREASLNCDSNIVSMKRLGLRRNWQYGCPLVLYGSLCKASKDNASVVATVVSFDGGDGLVLTANWFGGHAPADFSGGMLSWVSKLGREYRTIGNVTTDGAITYLGPLRDIKPGTEMTVTLGCNHQKSDCVRLHSNILNYGGQPWIPVKNPVKIHPYW